MTPRFAWPSGEPQGSPFPGDSSFARTGSRSDAFDERKHGFPTRARAPKSDSCAARKNPQDLDLGGRTSGSRIGDAPVCVGLELVVSIAVHPDLERRSDDG